MGNFSPIVLFAYNRPWHTRQAIESLQKNDLAKDSDLFIFSDATKSDLDKEKVQEVRNYIKIINGFKNIYIIERPENFGLAKNIVSGVTQIVDKYGKIIVLEDDIIISPAFLKFMNNALDIYKKDEKVMHISGYFFPIKNNLPATFFYNQTSCWGWATWKRAWQYYNPDAKFLLDEIKKKDLVDKFNFNNRHNFISQLIGNIDGKINTWAIKWQASIFLMNGLCLHSNQSFTTNIGHDKSGVHCKQNKYFDVVELNKNYNIEKIPIEFSNDAYKLVKNFYRKLRLSLFERLSLKFKKLTGLR